MIKCTFISSHTDGFTSELDDGFDEFDRVSKSGGN